MGTIVQDIRQGLLWVVIPLGLASILRLALEPVYWSIRYVAWLLLLPSYLVIQRLVLGQDSPLRIRLALAGNLLAINIGYLMIGVALRSDTGWRADAFVYWIECAIFGGDPQRFLVPLQTPWLSTLTMLGYLGYMAYLVYLFLAEAFVLSARTGRMQLGVMRMFGVGFSGYLLLPAAGPAFFHPAILPEIKHSAFTAWAQPLVLSNCSGVDVCPSLHAAVCCFLLIWVFQHHRRIFPLLIPPSLLLLLGTVYLHYHYFLDLPFGLLLGAWAAFSVSHELPSPVLPSPSAAD